MAYFLHVVICDLSNFGMDFEVTLDEIVSKEADMMVGKMDSNHVLVVNFNSAEAHDTLDFFANRAERVCGVKFVVKMTIFLHYSDIDTKFTAMYHKIRSVRVGVVRVGFILTNEFCQANLIKEIEKYGAEFIVVCAKSRMTRMACNCVMSY